MVLSATNSWKCEIISLGSLKYLAELQLLKQ
jgi:hypothetical protein